MVSLAVVCVIGFGFYAANLGKLGELSGERVFYLDSASSQGLRKEELSLLDIFRVEGECVRFDRMTEEEEDLVLRIQELYDAETLFTEEVDGVTSYYCFVDGWENAIELSGLKVNLHIAVSKEVCTVGTPIIFDGF